MKLFGLAEKPKKYQDSVKSETAKVEAARNTRLKQFEDTERGIQERIGKENEEFTVLLETHKRELSEILVIKRDAEHQIREASSGFKSTQSRLNTFEKHLAAREQETSQKEALILKKLEQISEFEMESARLMKASTKELEAAKTTAKLLVKEAEEKRLEAATVRLQAEREKKQSSGIQKRAEDYLQSVLLKEKRVKALEENLVYREKELEKRIKKVMSQEAAMAAAYKEIYGKN